MRLTPYLYGVCLAGDPADSLDRDTETDIWTHQGRWTPFRRLDSSIRESPCPESGPERTVGLPGWPFSTWDSHLAKRFDRESITHPRSTDDDHSMIYLSLVCLHTL